MGIHKLSDSILVNRRCIAYAEMGREEELSILFGIMDVKNAEGTAITAADIRDHAEAVAEEWGVKSSEKANCFVCSEKQPATKLCPCYFETLITTLNLRAFFEKLPNDGTAFSYICLDCKKDTSVPIRVVKQQYTRQGKYSMPTLCYKCHNDGRRPQRGPQAYQPPKLGEKANAGQKLASLQQEVAASSTSTPEG